MNDNELNPLFGSCFSYVMVETLNDMERFGYAQPCNDGVEVNLKCSKILIGSKLSKYVEEELSAKNFHISLYESWIYDRFSHYKFYVKDKKGNVTDVTQKMAKQFSVMLRKLEKCFPTNIIIAPVNVAKDDFRTYEKYRLNTAEPKNMRRFRKFKEEFEKK